MGQKTYETKVICGERLIATTPTELTALFTSHVNKCPVCGPTLKTMNQRDRNEYVGRHRRGE